MEAAVTTAISWTVADPMNAPATKVDAAVAAATPLLTIHTAVAAAAR